MNNPKFQIRRNRIALDFSDWSDEDSYNSVICSLSDLPPKFELIGERKVWISFANLKCAELIDWNVFRDAYEASQDFLASFEKFIDHVRALEEPLNEDIGLLITQILEYELPINFD